MSVDQYCLCAKKTFATNLASEIVFPCADCAPSLRQTLFTLRYNRPRFFFAEGIERERESGATSRLAFAGLMQEWLDAEVPLLSKTGVVLNNLQTLRHTLRGACAKSGEQKCGKTKQARWLAGWLDGVRAGLLVCWLAACTENNPDLQVTLRQRQKPMDSLNHSLKLAFKLTSDKGKQQWIP